MTAEAPLLVLRADADSSIGAGHVMRCLALAQEWQRQGGEAVFAGRIGAGSTGQRLESEGFQVHSLPALHPDPQDLSSFLSWLQERRGRPGWLVVDGYHFDGDYHQGLAAAGWPLLVIDDCGHLPLYHADILVNPNAYAKEIDYHAKDGAMLLLGCCYALLRQEFRKAEMTPYTQGVAGEAQGCRSQRILVTMGGADPDNVSGQVIDALLAMARRDLEIKVVVGPFNLHRPQLLERLGNAALSAELLTSVLDMVPLMQWADLAVSAAGSTCWELAALGVPMVVTVLADNQERLAASLVSHGAAVSLGWHHAWQTDQAAAMLDNLLARPQALQEMGRRGQDLVDGQGCKRLVQAMLACQFSLRPATLDDCETVFRWANEPLTRQASFHAQSITWPEHSLWFAERLADPEHVFFIAIDSLGRPMGQVRFALEEDTAVLSVGLDHDFRGMGLGHRLIRQACQHLMADRPLTKIRAFIKPGNAPSVQAFAKAGFCPGGNVEVLGQGAIAMDYTPEEVDS